ncbi:MAG: isopentenyl-diphosphate Delta-isomerase [Bacteroidetes bacterium SW_9_63_38]|nr:MAG: isopentenyl-diphosphate Delta-isomerase [Bacteroidetes bacterium SW_9_63_38]
MSTRVVLVNEDGQPTGTTEKLRAHTEGRRHRALSVFVFDTEGRLLLQQRTPEKYHSGGLWSNTCCSHPRPDELPEEAARRRLREEMGFACSLTPLFHFTYHASVGDGLVEYEYDHVFVGRVTTADIRPDPTEVADWAWTAPTALRANLQAAPHQYTVWFRRLLGPVLADDRSPVSAQASANHSR